MTTENDDLARVTSEGAIKFLEGACRNWRHVPRLSDDDIRDVATELERFIADRLPAQGEPVAWIVGRIDREGNTALCLPLLHSREEMERYARNNPDETLVPLFAHTPPAGHVVVPVEVVDAARELVAGRFSTYRARNGRQVSIEGDDGERCWIVPNDEMFALETALAAPMAVAPNGRCCFCCMTPTWAASLAGAAMP